MEKLQGTSVLSPFIPIAIVIVPAFIIFQKSVTNLVQNHPCLYLLTFGLIIAKITNKLVVRCTSLSLQSLPVVLFNFLSLFDLVFISERSLLVAHADRAHDPQ